jgi:hypothetical protein
MSLADRIMGVESGGNPFAQNPRSSAGGAGQFIDATWLDMLRKHRPDIQGTREELLKLKFDPKLSKEMTDAYAADNGRILGQAGHAVTPGTTYLAHFAGPQGAVSLLSANPTASAESILGQQAIAANPFLKGKTAGDVIAWANQKMGGQPAQPAQGQPLQIVPQAPQPATSETLAASIMGQPQQPQQQRPRMAANFDPTLQHAQFAPLRAPDYGPLAAQILGEDHPAPPVIQLAQRRAPNRGLF